MASGWKLWVWLPCVGVARGCCFKEVYSRLPDLENEKVWFQVTLVREKFFVGHAHLQSHEDTY